jgi:hypothetical protein
MKFRCTLLLFTLLALSGCGSSPRLIPVSGSITVKGKPAEGAILMFHPASPTDATGSAVAEADGNFKIVSGGEPGLLQGKYQVTVIWPDPTKKPTQAQIMMGTAEPGPDLLKDKYSSKATSPLSAEITPASTKLPPFEL